MTFRIRWAARFSVLLAFVLVACDASKAELYRYGNLVADIPAGWTSTQVITPGVTLVTFSEKEDDAALIWLEVTPSVNMSPEKLVMTIVEASGARQIKRRSDVTHANGYEMVMDAKIDGEDVRATFSGFRKGSQLYVLGFVAEPSNFVRMDGTDFLLATFNGGEEFNVSTAVPSLPSPTKVVAEAGRYRLTQQMIDDLIALTEYLAAQPLTAEDKRFLRREIIDDFPTATADDMADFRAAGTLMSQLATATAIKRAQIRRDMISTIWFDAQKLQEESPLLDLIFRYNPILGVDEALGLVAPRASLDALLASNSFVATKAGLKPLTPDDRDRLAAEIRDGFGSLNEKQKRYLANGEVNWLKLITVWQFWDEQAQKKHLNIVGVNGIKTPDQVPQVARNLEHWAGIDANSREVMKLIRGQGDMLVLEHLRGTLSVYGP